MLVDEHIIVMEQLQSMRGSANHKYYLELSLLVVFSDAVILAGSSVEAVANTQDGGEQGTGELVTNLDGQLDRLGSERRPCQVTITWSGEHKSGLTVRVKPAQQELIHISDIAIPREHYGISYI